MHAACCRVAHMSGAAGYLDDILDDHDEGKPQFPIVSHNDVAYAQIVMRQHQRLMTIQLVTIDLFILIEKLGESCE